MENLPTIEGLSETLRPPTCSICWQEYAPGHEPAIADCGHIFGLQCILKWVETGNHQAPTCPLCRKALFNPTNNSDREGTAHHSGPYTEGHEREEVYANENHERNMNTHSSQPYADQYDSEEMYPNEGHEGYNEIDMMSQTPYANIEEEGSYGEGYADSEDYESERSMIRTRTAVQTGLTMTTRNTAQASTATQTRGQDGDMSQRNEVYDAAGDYIAVVRDDAGNYYDADDDLSSGDDFDSDDDFSSDDDFDSDDDFNSDDDFDTDDDYDTIE
jgi:hypothetical protein